MKKIDEHLSLYEDVREIPWFQEAVAKSKAYLRSLPEDARPSWIRENPGALDD